jgi:transposase
VAPVMLLVSNHLQPYEATSMNDSTSVLFGLEDEFVVASGERLDKGDLRVVIEHRDREAACPSCGVLTTRVKDRPVVRVKDLDASGQAVQLWWRKRRLRCLEPPCSRGTFTQQSQAIPARARLTVRLREALAVAIASGNRAVDEVARSHRVSWPTAHRALIAAAARWLPEPEPTRVLGIDETRARSVRWVLADAGWRRSDPWLTSFVDADTTGPGRMLGLAPGRSGACVKDWLNEQSQAFRDAVQVVVIDTSAPYASGIRVALPHAKMAVDKWHLVALANQMLTEVRQRVTREQLGRRGTTKEKVWVNRHLLLTGYEHLSDKQRRRLDDALAIEDPTGAIGAAWAVKERLRLLLAETDVWRIRHRLYQFYCDAADAHIPEATRLAKTIETWWPAILVALLEDVTNARTEGFNRIIKNTKRVACGFRNLENYQRRVLSTIALTRAQRDAA